MGLLLRSSSLANSGNTITIKGTALAYNEADGNFMYLLTNMSGSTISITGSTGVLGSFTATGTTKFTGLTNSNGTNLVTYNSSTGQLFYYNTGSLNVGTASYVTSLVQNVSLTGSLNVTGSITLSDSIPYSAGKLTVSSFAGKSSVVDGVLVLTSKE